MREPLVPAALATRTETTTQGEGGRQGRLGGVLSNDTWKRAAVRGERRTVI